MQWIKVWLNRLLIIPPIIDIDLDMDGGCKSALLCVAESDPDFVQFLIERGAKVNFQGSYSTPLITAIRSSRWGMGNEAKKIIDLLLKNGAHSNLPSYSDTPLNAAVLQYNLPEVFHRLIAEGADPNVRIPANGRTVLMNVIRGLKPQNDRHEREKSQVVKLLLDTGADLLIKDDKGRTAMDYAQKLPHSIQKQQIIKLLSDRMPFAEEIFWQALEEMEAAQQK